MEFESCYRTGYVIKRHGLKGDVKVRLDVTLPKKLESIFVDIDNRLVPFFIEHYSVLKDQAIIKFEDVDGPDQADKLTKHDVYLPFNVRPKTRKPSLELEDLIGFTVITKSVTLGKVSTVNDHDLNPLLVVETEQKEILIPVNDFFVKKIDKKSKSIQVELPDGFLDI